MARKGKRARVSAHFGAGEVGDGVERHAGGGELGEELGGAVDGAGHGLVPALVEGGDQLGVVGVAGGEGGDAFVPGGAAVELEVPGVEVDLGEEGVDGRLVGQELAVEEARVPADQDVADVEDEGVGSCGASG